MAHPLRRAPLVLLVLAACAPSRTALREPPTDVREAALAGIDFLDAEAFATRYRFRGDYGIEADLRVAKLERSPLPRTPLAPVQARVDTAAAHALGTWRDLDVACAPVDGTGLATSPRPRDAAIRDVVSRDPATRGRPSPTDPWSSRRGPDRCRTATGAMARWLFTLEGDDRQAVLRIDVPVSAMNAQETPARVRRLARALLGPMLPLALAAH